MNSLHLGTARGILRNTAAQILLGVLDKGAGLLVAVLVARFLGAEAMGLFALLFSAALLIQALVSLGLPEVSCAKSRPARTPPAASVSWQ